MTSIDTLNALITPGRYLRYISIENVGLPGGWAVIDVSALDGYDNYVQMITYPATGATYTRQHPTEGTWRNFESLYEQIGTVDSKIPKLITNAHNNTNAYNAGSNGWEEFTFQSSQWPDGYQFCAFSSGGAGNGILVLCKIDVDNANKTVKLLLRNDTSNNVAAGVTGVQCNVLIMKP